MNYDERVAAVTWTLLGFFAVLLFVPGLAGWLGKVRDKALRYFKVGNTNTL